MKLPGKYFRSKGSGVPAEVIRTTKRTPAGDWLYKMWYGDFMGNGRYTLDDLLTWNVRWFDNKPVDLKSRAMAARERKQ